MSPNVFRISKGLPPNWPVTIAMVLSNLGVLSAVFTFHWRLLAAGIFLYWRATGLGISD